MLQATKIVQCVTIAAGAAGTSAITGSTIDFADAEGALIVVQLGPIVTGAVTSIKFMEGETTSPVTDVAGTNITITDAQDNEIVYLNIRRPGKRYGALYVSRGTQAATVSAVAYVYGQRSKPVSQVATVTGEEWLGAVAGTA